MSIKQELRTCVDELRNGRLTEARLTAIIDAMPDQPNGRHQDLLYIQAQRSSIESAIQGYSLFINGRRLPGPADPQDWPYQTVKDALADGWRIISFPDMALMIDDQVSFGLGCEFILEKWG